MVVMAAAMTSAFPGCGKDSKPEEQVNVRAGEPNNVEDEIKEPVNA